jgi:hypothetical protein
MIVAAKNKDQRKIDDIVLIAAYQAGSDIYWIMLFALSGLYY